MKILHLEASCGWGGQDMRVFTVCRELQRRGHDVTLACQPSSELVRRAKREAFKTYLVPMARPYDLQAFWKIVKIVKKEKIEILHTHSSIDSWIGACIKKWCPAVKLVRTRHVSTRLSRNLPTHWLYAQPDLILTTAESIAFLLKNRFPRIKQIISLPTGIEEAKFQPAKVKKGLLRRELCLGSREILVGTVGVLRSWKGHDLFLKVAKRLSERRDDLRFLLIGEGPARNRLESLAFDLKLKDRVVFVGFREDVASVLADLNIFLFPSYASEGVPQALLQALAMGKAIVATCIGGIPEVIRNGETGLLVPPNDAQALLNALLLLLENPQMARLLSRNGRLSLVKKFSQERMMDRLEELYCNLLR